MAGASPRREVIPAALAGERLDRVAAMLLGTSRAVAGGLVDAGGVRVDGQVVTQRSARLDEGSVLELDPLAEPVDDRPVAEADVAVEVVYADDDVVVVDKPAGLVVHPGAGHRHGTLVSGLLARFPEIASVGDPERPGIVHRLDRGTSGLLAVARSAAAYEGLVAQLSGRSVDREYLALVRGRPDPAVGVVDAPIGRSRRAPTRMTVASDGRPARTRYELERALRTGARRVAPLHARDGPHAPDPGAPAGHRPSRRRRRRLRRRSPRSGARRRARPAVPPRGAPRLRPPDAR